MDDESFSHLQGDYGTGKTLILDAVARKMNSVGSNVTVLSALDYLDERKKNHDVLDIIFRQRYSNTGITFYSLADLRRGQSSSNYHILVYS